MLAQGQSLVQLFRQFVDSADLPAAVSTFDELRQHLEVNERQPDSDSGQQQQQRVWEAIGQQVGCNEAKTLCRCLTTRASHAEYDSQGTCSNTSVLIVGGGPCGLRAAIECSLLGARRVVVVESRDYISRNNILYLWPLVMSDLKSIGAKVFYSKFGTGSIDHISTRRLQLLLLKIALVCGAEIHAPVKFQSLVEPDVNAGHGWKAAFSGATISRLEDYEFDVIIGADGKLNTVPGFKRKLFRGKMAIAITANFTNRRTPVENRVNEISGLAYIFHQEFFNDLKTSTGIELENFVYYKGDTHYFVMTPKKSSLLRKGILKKDFADPTQLLSTDNVDVDSLKAFVCAAASSATKLPISTLPFATTHRGEDDIAIFDFTALHQAEHSSYIRHRHGHNLLLCVVGDTLLEPFWPIGSGVARGFLGVFDAAWLIRGCAINGRPSLEQIAERESVYQLLSQAKPDNMNKNLAEYTIDPRTRYGRLTNLKSMRADQVKQLYVDCDANVGVSNVTTVPKPLDVSNVTPSVNNLSPIPKLRGVNVVKTEVVTAGSASQPATIGRHDDTNARELAVKSPQPSPGGKSPVIGRRKALREKQQLIDTLRATLTTSIGGLVIGSQTLRRSGGKSFVKQCNTEQQQQQQQQQHTEQKMDDRIEKLLATLRVVPCRRDDDAASVDIYTEASSKPVRSAAKSVCFTTESEISDDSKRKDLDRISQETRNGRGTTAAAAAVVSDEDSDLDDADIDEAYQAALLALKNTISSKMVELDDLMMFDEMTLAEDDDDLELPVIKKLENSGDPQTNSHDQLEKHQPELVITEPQTNSGDRHIRHADCVNRDFGVNDSISQETNDGKRTTAAAAAAAVTDEDSDLGNADIDEAYQAALLALKNTISSKMVELDDLVMLAADDDDLELPVMEKLENSGDQMQKHQPELVITEPQTNSGDQMQKHQPELVITEPQTNNGDQIQKHQPELVITEPQTNSGDQMQKHQPELVITEPQTNTDDSGQQAKQRFHEVGQQLKDWLDAISAKISDPKIDRQTANAFKGRFAELQEKHLNVFAQMDLLTDINDEDCREFDEDVKVLSGEISDLQEFVNFTF